MGIWTVALINHFDYEAYPWISSFTSEEAADAFMAEADKKLVKYGVRDNFVIEKDNMAVDSTEYLNWIDREYGPDSSRLYKRFEIFLLADSLFLF